MEDEFDLGNYLQILYRHWIIIAVTTLAFGACAAVMTFFAAPVFQTSTTLVKTVVVNPPSALIEMKTLLDLAKSEAVVRAASEKLIGKLDPSELNPGKLLGKIDAKARDNFIDISATGSSAQKAVYTANAWAEALTSCAKDYFRKVQPDIEELKTMSDTALAIYAAKKQDLARYQGELNLNNTGNKLASVEIIYDLRVLRRKLETNGLMQDAMVSQAFYGYQASVLGSIFPGLEVLPPEGGQLSVTDINHLASVLENGAGVSSLSTDELLSLISELNFQNRAAHMTLDRLTIARDAARASYQNLAKQLMDAELVNQSPKSPLKIVEPAAVPVATASSSPSIAIALAMGVITGILLAFGWDYFRTRSKTEKNKGAGPNQA